MTITLYEHLDKTGKEYSLGQSTFNFKHIGMNDKVSSWVVEGPGEWYLFEDINLMGREWGPFTEGEYNVADTRVRNDKVSSAEYVPPGGDRYWPDVFVGGFEGMTPEEFAERGYSISLVDGKYVVIKPGEEDDAGKSIFMKYLPWILILIVVGIIAIIWIKRRKQGGTK